MPWVANGADIEAALKQHEAARAAALQEADSEQRAAHQAAAREALLSARTAYESKGITRSTDRDSVLGYARVLRLLGDADLAVEALDRLLSVYPEEGSLHLALAEGAREIGPTGREQAMAAAQRARHYADDDEALLAQANALLAMLYWDAELFSFAREFLDAALAHHDGTTEWRLYDAALLARDGAVTEAWTALEKLGRAVQPYDPLARALIRKALWDFDKMRRTVPDTAEAHGAYGRLLYQSGRLPDAVLALRRAVSLRPEDTDTWNILGAIHTQLGSIEQAIQAYEASLAAQSNQPQVQSVLQRLRAAVAQQPSGE